MKIGKTGGITYIIAAMSNHAKSTRVQQQACAALWNLSASGTLGQQHNQVLGTELTSSPAELNRQKIAVQNGIPRLVLTMRYHATDAKIQALACGALRTLATDSATLVPCFALLCFAMFLAQAPAYGSLAGKLRSLIGTEDCVVSILNAMRGHEENRLVQERACNAFQLLAAEGVSSPPLSLAGRSSSSSSCARQTRPGR
jgi:hypothetical protein